MTYNPKKANEKAKYKAAKSKAETKSKVKPNKIGPNDPNYSSSLELYIEIA